MEKNNIEVLKPFKNNYTMTQPFGRFFDFNGRRLKHQGTDWALPTGTPVLSCFEGLVVRVEKYRLNGYGRSVYLRSTSGKFEALYAHLENIFVEVGDKVGVGIMLGHSGNTGFGTGPHLHFGLKLYGEYVDAEKYIEVEISEKNKLLKTDEYIVEKGDTLFDIASKFFVAGDFWPLLYRENEKVIGSDPNLIKPGQVLKIPKASKI